VIANDVCTLCQRDLRPLTARLGRVAVYTQHVNTHLVDANKELLEAARAVTAIEGELRSDDVQVARLRSALGRADVLEEAIAKLEKQR
jgi:hypothetical protein